MTPEDLQKNAINIMQLAIKATPAGAKADPNQVMFELAGNWAAVSSHVNELNLQPLYNALRTRSCSPQEAAMVCLLVQRREDRLGVKVTLPTEVQSLSAQARIDLLASVPKTGGTGLTVVPLSGVKVPAPGTPSAPTPAARLPDSAPVPAGSGQVRMLPPTPRRRLPVSGGTLAASVLLLVLTGIIKVAGREKGLEPLDVKLPASLASYKVFIQEEYVFFYDFEGNFDLPQEKLEALGQEMFALAKANGGTRVYMCLREESKRCTKVKALSREGRTIFLNNKPPPKAP